MNHRSVILYIAATLDGYIATEDDSLEWLFRVEGEGDNGYGAFIETVDTVIMGRRTYDWIIEHEQGRHPYPGKDCYVYSRSRTGKDEFVTYISEDAAAFIDRLQAREGKKIWLVGGGSSLVDFLKAGVLDEIVVNVAPVVLGQGIPMFPQGDYSMELTLTGMKQYGQFAELHYLVKK